jgi:hypothetical protein
MSDATEILNAIAEGDPQAASRLLPLVYEELRQLAAQELAHEKPGQTLDATGLVHEAYLRLALSGGRQPPESGRRQPPENQPHWNSRGRRSHAPYPGGRRPPQAVPEARRATPVR